MNKDVGKKAESVGAKKMRADMADDGSLDAA